jgi:hypothetical protein
MIPNLLTDSTYIKRKYLVKSGSKYNNSKINLIGMLIGPKGMYHKLLEEASGCYMFIKGRNAMN